jgi:hypothetical protein
MTKVEKKHWVILLVESFHLLSFGFRVKGLIIEKYTQNHFSS